LTKNIWDFQSGGMTTLHISIDSSQNSKI